jgi:3-hydroxyisobutyrate dehydrogenase-like beta-hydroxyacid dehydrogenase
VQNMRTVAFIGLGIMGRPMAANLVKALLRVIRRLSGLPR